MEDKELKYTFGWDLCHTCNYRCPYCHVWEKHSPKDIMLDGPGWERIWGRIFDKYGSCHIYMSGGEPSHYPYFFDLVRRLTKKHSVEICTNLSWDVDKLIPEIPAGTLRVASTFHPAFAVFEDFFMKVVKIKGYLPNNQIYYVAYHGIQIKEMVERSRRLKERGINLIPLPLRGNQEVLNSEEEEKIIREVSPYKSDKIEYQLQKITPRGKLCRAGQRYAVIRAHGGVDRCSQCSIGEVGNITDEAFRLFDEPRACEKDYCPIESQWIIDK